jgi:hypothetical protein
MAIDKLLIALKDNATAGFLNVVDPALISKAQDNATKIEFARSIEFLDGKVSYVTPEDYGAVGDGVTNDSAAIQSALNSGLPLLIPQNTYLISATVSIPTGAFIFGYGFKSKLLTTSNITMLRITQALDVANITIESIQLSGNRVGNAQKGLVCSGGGGNLNNYHIKVSKCDFNNFSFAVEVGASGSSNYKSVMILQGCIFFNNFSGFSALTRGEYNLINNCSFNGNDFGVNFFQGGNNSMVGGQITNGGVGFKVTSGDNNGHAQCVGVKINHNTVNVEANLVSLNYLFSACMFYAGKILINGATGVRFDSCEFGTWELEITNSNLTVFSNCMYQTNPTPITDTGNTNTINRGAIFKTGVKVPVLINDDELKDKAGTVVSFERAFQHGYPTAETGNITFDFTRAISGMTQTMRHNSGTKPTLPATANRLSGDYVISVDNQIYFTPILESAGVYRVDVTVAQDNVW